jgi:hypothetical protein
MRGRPLVRYPFGIRRRLQHRRSRSGRGSGLDGRPSGLRTMWRRRLRSNLGFLPRSRRQPHPAGRMCRPRRPVRVLRQGSRVVRRCSRGPRLERRLRASLEQLLLPALQLLLAWWPQPPPRPVSRRQPDSQACHRDPAVRASPAVRSPSRADQLVPPSLLPNRKRGCPLDHPLLPRGRRVRRCSHQLRHQCRQRARRLNRSSRTH